jgi:microcystin degradation protein MlrC
MRIAIIELKQESNTFSPFATTLASFEQEGYLLHGPAIFTRLRGTNTEIAGFLEVLEPAGYAPVPLVAAWALSGGKLRAQDWHALRTLILDSLRACGPIDALLVALHGALVAEDCDDTEADLLLALRAIVGPAMPIVCTLDMHGCITPTLAREATALVAYHTSPHIDLAETGRRAARLLVRLLDPSRPHAPRLSACLVRLAHVVPAENSATTDSPMREVFDQIRALEREPAVLSAALFPTQPWLDLPDLGSSAYVLTEADPHRAESAAVALVHTLWSLRHELEPQLLSIDAALQAADAPSGLSVFSDSADSTTSGSPGDSTHILRALLRADLSRPAFVPIVDPAAARCAEQAGPGAHVSLSLGGKLDRIYNQPLAFEGEVVRCGEFGFTLDGKAFSGLRVELGLSAVLRCGQVFVLVTSRRALTVDPALYRCAGLEPQHAGIVCVKSPVMYRTNYAAIAARMFTIDAPGASPADFTRLDYRRRPAPCFPWERESSPRISITHVER